MSKLVCPHCGHEILKNPSPYAICLNTFCHRYGISQNWGDLKEVPTEVKKIYSRKRFQHSVECTRETFKKKKVINH